MFNIAASAERARELEKLLSMRKVTDGLRILQGRQAKSASPERGRWHGGRWISQMSYTLQGSISPPEVVWGGLSDSMLLCPRATFWSHKEPRSQLDSYHAVKFFMFLKECSSHWSDAYCGNYVLESTVFKNPWEQAPFQHLLLYFLMWCLLHSGARLAWQHEGGIMERMGHSKDGGGFGMRQDWPWVWVLTFTCLMTFYKYFASLSLAFLIHEMMAKMTLVVIMFNGNQYLWL